MQRNNFRREQNWKMDNLPPPKPFRPDATDVTGETWKSWKQSFEIYLAARALDEASDKRKVNLLLHLLGVDGQKLYNTFVFAPAIPARDGQEAIPAEDKEKLKDVLKKFDRHYGHKKFRAVKRQRFLDRTQKEGETLMDFIADLRHHAKSCEYGQAEESLPDNRHYGEGDLTPPVESETNVPLESRARNVTFHETNPISRYDHGLTNQMACSKGRWRTANLDKNQSAHSLIFTAEKSMAPPLGKST